MERNILRNMISVRKTDLEIIKVPYYKDQNVLRDLNIFLEKEIENLVDDTKAIDNIRVDYHLFDCDNIFNLLLVINYRLQ